MVTEYHNQIDKALFRMGCDWSRKRRIKISRRGNEYPLSIVDPRTKRVVNYQPDVYFILRNNRKLIFEIVDSEGEKQDIIIADVIRSFLVENVDGLFFIHPGPESVENAIIEALITVYKGLVRKGVDESELPNYKKTGAYLIRRDMAGDFDKLSEILTRYAEEDKWFKSLIVAKKRAYKAVKNG